MTGDDRTHYPRMDFLWMSPAGLLVRIQIDQDPREKDPQPPADPLTSPRWEMSDEEMKTWDELKEAGFRFIPVKNHDPRHPRQVALPPALWMCPRLVKSPDQGFRGWYFIHAVPPDQSYDWACSLPDLILMRKRR